MYKLKMVLVFLSLVTTQIVVAQDDFIKRADKLYDNKVYSEASKIYLTYLQQSYNYDVNYKLAECYRNMNQTIEAEFWYEVIVNQNIADENIIYNYANLLKSNGKYKSAKTWFLKYGAYDDDGFYLASTCDWALANEGKPVAYLLDSLGINSSGSEITPTFFKKGIIFSGSGGKKINVSTGLPYYDLYFSEMKNDSIWSVTRLNNSINSDLHEASPCYDQIDETLYFTRNNINKNRTITSKDDEVKLQMFYSNYIDNKFLAPIPMPFNSKTYSFGHSALSPDGSILIFSSDKPGGYGGTDLYFATKKGDGWSAVKNLGPVINTKGDELFPYMDPEGNLYFTSNWLPGFGGMDVFKSSRDGDHWSVPVNAGKPLNSSHDDFGFVIKNGRGYVTSNRPGGQGSDDIYGVTEALSLSKIYLYDTNLKPITKARITLVESPKAQPICETDANGMCDISALSNSNMSIRISKEGFLDKVINNLGSYRSSNGILPVELQPLLGNIENTPSPDLENITQTNDN